MGTQKEKLILASIWSSWTPRLLSRTLPVLQGSNSRDGGQVESWWVKWHFLKGAQKEKWFLISIWMSWTPWLLSRTLPVLQGSNARDGGQVASWWIKCHFLKETPKEKLFLASIGMSWTLKLLSGSISVLQGSNDLNDWREDLVGGGRSPWGSHASDCKGKKFGKAKPAARRA